MAVAIDGEIFQGAYLAQLKPESEICFPKIDVGYPAIPSLRGAAGAAATRSRDCFAALAMTSRLIPPAPGGADTGK